MAMADAIGPLPIEQRAPADLVMDLVVAALRDSAALTRLVPADQINAYGWLPVPDAPIFAPAMMVAPLSTTDIVAPGEILSTCYIQVVLRYQMSSNDPKEPGEASIATQLWETARVLFALKLLKIRNGLQEAPLAHEYRAVPVHYPAVNTSRGWIQDLAQGWQYTIPLDSQTLRPRALAQIGLA